MLPISNKVRTNWDNHSISKSRQVIYIVLCYFSFQHQMSLVRDGSLFTERVSRAPISGNIDNPEGGLDALMQVMVCGQKIGWREGARRVIIYTSDQVRPEITHLSTLKLILFPRPSYFLPIVSTVVALAGPGCK